MLTCESDLVSLRFSFPALGRIDRVQNEDILFLTQRFFRALFLLASLRAATRPSAAADATERERVENSFLIPFAYMLRK